MPIFLLPYIPFIRAHIDKINMLARVGDVAANGHRVEQTVLDCDILECDIAQSDPGLRCAGALLVEGVEHAAWAVAVGLLHLLGADVDCPPQWPDHCEVIVVDVLDQPCALVAGVGLHVDAFQCLGDMNIPEGDIPNTVTPQIRGHTADGHADPQDNPRILDQHILSTVPAHVALMARLRHNNVIKILHGQVINMHSGPTGINAIRVEREQRDHAFQGEFLQQVYLGRCVYQNCNVVQLCVVAFVHFQVELS